MRSLSFHCSGISWTNHTTISRQADPGGTQSGPHGSFKYLPVEGILSGRDARRAHAVYRPTNESLAVTHHSHTRVFAVRHGPPCGTVTPLQLAGAGRSATSLTRLPYCRYAAWPCCAAFVSCVCVGEGDRVSRLRDSGDHHPERRFLFCVPTVC